MSRNLLCSLINISFILLACWFRPYESLLSTRGHPPQIYSISPNIGSSEGGTQLTINGANFAQSGLFTSRAVYIDNELCKEIDYYTTDTQIVCITPKCMNPDCLSSPTWSGSSRVDVDVYLQTVEGILGKSTTFLYTGGSTPSIFKMSHYGRGNVPSFVQGYITTDKIQEINIKIGDNFASLGDPSELNPPSLNAWSWTTKVWYQPSMDMNAGFYNLSMSVQSDQSKGDRANGLARMFPKQKPYPQWDYFYTYNFDSSASGEVYSYCLQPVIESVSPSIGSLVGGTKLTIKGGGFSKDKSQIAVLAGGRPCDVISADHEEIICITRLPEPLSTLNDYIKSVSYDTSTFPYFSKPVVGSSNRNFGSAGWWMKMWNKNNYYSNKMTDNNVQFSLGWKSGSLFSMNYYFEDNTWPSKLGYTAGNNDVIFAADFQTYLIAPCTGLYQFYMTSDDSSNLYGTRLGDNERELMATSYTPPGDYYTNPSSKRSKVVYLARGEKYRLRARLVNTGGPDYIEIGMKIMPNYTSNGVLVDELQSYSKYQQDPYVAKFNLNSSTFLHHHTLKDVQVISLSMQYRYEKQVKALLLSMWHNLNLFTIFI
jgi:hypothetical protein